MENRKTKAELLMEKINEVVYDYDSIYTTYVEPKLLRSFEPDNKTCGFSLHLYDICKIECNSNEYKFKTGLLEYLDKEGFCVEFSDRSYVCINISLKNN